MAGSGSLLVCLFLAQGSSVEVDTGHRQGSWQPIISLVIMVLLVVAALAFVRVRTRRRQREDARHQLDPTTQAWLAARTERSDGRPSHRDNTVRWVDRVERRPEGTRQVLEAFRYRTRKDYVTVVVVPAECGPTPMVAMSWVPARLGSLFEPGLEMVHDRLCPDAWSLFVASGTSEDEVMSSPVPRAVARLDPGDASGTSDPDMDDEVLAAVRYCRGSLRLDFHRDRAYVLYSASQSTRPKLIAEAIAVLLSSGGGSDC